MARTGFRPPGVELERERRACHRTQAGTKTLRARIASAILAGSGLRTPLRITVSNES